MNDANGSIPALNKLKNLPLRMAPSRVPEDRQNASADGNTRPAATSEDLGPRDLARAVESLNNHFQSVERDLKFDVDEATDHVVITVMDGETGEVIRQIPPEEVLATARRLREQMEDGTAGLLLRGEV